MLAEIEGSCTLKFIFFLLFSSCFFLISFLFYLFLMTNTFLSQAELEPGTFWTMIPLLHLNHLKMSNYFNSSIFAEFKMNVMSSLLTYFFLVLTVWPDIYVKVAWLSELLFFSNLVTLLSYVLSNGNQQYNKNVTRLHRDHWITIFV